MKTISKSLAAALAVCSLVPSVAAQQHDAAQAEAEAPPVLSPQQKKAGGNSWFEHTEIDMGSFLEGETATAVFEFKNPSTESHRLSAIRPSCACAKTVIRVGERTYRLESEPTPHSIYRVIVDGDGEHKELVQFITIGGGEGGEVEVKVDLRGVTGKKEAYFQAQTTDPALPMMSLKCWAVASTYFQVMPPEVNLNKMGWNEQRDFMVQVTSPIQPDFEIVGHDPLPDGMKIEYRKQSTDGAATWVITGSYGPNLDPRASGGILQLQSDVQGKKVAVRVLAYIEGPLVVRPGTFLALGLVRQSQGITKVVELEPSDDFDLQVEKIELANLTVPEEFVEVSCSKEDKIVKVAIRILPSAPRRLVRGEITLQLNHPAVKTSEIQFNGYVR